MILEKKLTLKSFGLPEHTVTGAFVVRILGIASGFDKKPSKFDPTQNDICLSGEFQATSSDGEFKLSQKCWLDSATAKIVAQKIENSAGPVEFGFDYYVRSNDKSPVGYEWVVSPHNYTPSPAFAALSLSAPPMPEFKSLPEPAKKAIKK